MDVRCREASDPCANNADGMDRGELLQILRQRQALKKKIDELFNKRQCILQQKQELESTMAQKCRPTPPASETCQSDFSANVVLSSTPICQPAVPPKSKCVTPMSRSVCEKPAMDMNTTYDRVCRRNIKGGYRNDPAPVVEEPVEYSPCGYHREQKARYAAKIKKKKKKPSKCKEPDWWLNTDENESSRCAAPIMPN